MHRRIRLLLDPIAVDGGGGEAAPAAPPTPTPTPAELRSIPAAEHDAMLARLAEYETYRQTQAAELAKKESERIRALAAKGQSDEAITILEQSWKEKLDAQVARYEALDQAVLSQAKASAMLAAFNGRSFAGETPEDREAAQADLMRLIESDFEAVREGDAVVVREAKTRRAAADALKERLDGRRYARFLASNGGGAPPPPPTGGAGDDVALAANVAAWKARQLGGAVGLRRV